MSDNEEKDAIFGYSDDEVESQNETLCAPLPWKKKQRNKIKGIRRRTDLASKNIRRTKK